MLPVLVETLALTLPRSIPQATRTAKNRSTREPLGMRGGVDFSSTALRSASVS